MLGAFASTKFAMSDHDERERLKSLLDVHGQQFLSSFDLPPALKKKKISKTPELIDASPNASRSAEEWNGFSESNSREELSSSEWDEGSVINS